MRNLFLLVGLAFTAHLAGQVLPQEASIHENTRR